MKLVHIGVMLAMMACMTQPAADAAEPEPKKTESKTAEGAEKDALLKYFDQDDQGLLKQPKEWPPKIALRKQQMDKINVDKMQDALNAMNSSDYMVLEKAIYFLEMMGEDAVPSLVGILNGRGYNNKIYANTLYTVGRMGKNGVGAVPIVAQYMGHKDADMRAIAASAMGKMGKDASRAVPYLRKGLNDDNEWVRKNAEQALYDIGTPNALRALKEHKEMLKEKQ